MTMTQHHDNDGDSIVLTDDDRAHIEEELAQLDSELAQCRDSALFREKRHRRAHLAGELVVGHRLDLHPDDSTWYDHAIVPRAAELGGGWRLYLLEDGEEVGGGVFPVEQDEVASVAWWEVLSDDDRAQWLGRTKVDTAAGAYLAFLTDQAWHDAAQVAGEWLDSRPQP